jgi:hypothetical protein
MGNAVLDINEMISSAEEKNRENIDGSNVLSLQDTVTKREKTREELADEMRQKTNEIRKKIREYQIAEHGRVFTGAEIKAMREEAKAESRKEAEASFASYVAPLMPPLTAENLPGLREEYGEDFMKMVEDFKKTANGEGLYGTE